MPLAQLAVELLITILEHCLTPTRPSALSWTPADIDFLMSLRLVSRTFYIVAQRQLRLRTVIDSSMPWKLDSLLHSSDEVIIQSLAVVTIKRNQLPDIIRLLHIANKLERLMLVFPPGMNTSEYKAFGDGFRTAFPHIKDLAGIRMSPIFVHLLPSEKADAGVIHAPQLQSLVLDDELVDETFCRVLEQLPFLQRLALTRAHLTTPDHFLSVVEQKTSLVRVLLFGCNRFMPRQLPGAVKVYWKCSSVPTWWGLYERLQVPSHWCIDQCLSGEIWDEQSEEWWCKLP